MPTAGPRADIVGTTAFGTSNTREAFRMLLYCSQPHALIASRVRRAIERYVLLVSLDSLSYTFDGEGNPVKLDGSTFLELMDDWFVGACSQWGNATIKLVGPGGTSPLYALSYCGNALDCETLPDERSYLDMWVSREFFQMRAAELERFFVSTAKELEACSGYMTPALTGGDIRSKQALAARYAALDISEPSSVSFDIGYRSPGSYWFNYAGANLALGIGPIPELVRALGSAAEVAIPHGEAITIKLGTEPLLGDRNRFESLPAYEALARFLYARGLMNVPRHSVYFKNRQALADRDAQTAWHLRFVEQ